MWFPLYGETGAGEGRDQKTKEGEESLVVRDMVAGRKVVRSGRTGNRDMSNCGPASTAGPGMGTSRETGVENNEKEKGADYKPGSVSPLPGRQPFL